MRGQAEAGEGLRRQGFEDGDGGHGALLSGARLRRAGGSFATDAADTADRATERALFSCGSVEPDDRWLLGLDAPVPGTFVLP
ncbi:hypothetical protein GCM10018775_57740 [Streptomyces umbrinus]|nr:hypothetical protein GCM10018775_57740 [Streptomyces umbrinus]